MPFQHKPVQVSDFLIWIEQGESICIKSLNPHGDPIELNIQEARSLVEKLQVMLKWISKNQN